MTNNDSQKATPLDVALGARLRTQRKAVGMAQTQLANAVGISYQQVQKYEWGTNRISFSRLVAISHALNCRVLDLVGDLIDQADAPAVEPIHDDLAVEGAGELLAGYAMLPTPLRKAVTKMLAAAAGHATANE